jgi:hypothetical protein
MSSYMRVGLCLAGFLSICLFGLGFVPRLAFFSSPRIVFLSLRPSSRLFIVSMRFGSVYPAVGEMEPWILSLYIWPWVYIPPSLFLLLGLVSHLLFVSLPWICLLFVPRSRVCIASMRLEFVYPATCQMSPIFISLHRLGFISVVFVSPVSSLYRP